MSIRFAQKGINVKLKRNIRILFDIYKKTTFLEFIRTMSGALFRNELIYIYAIDVATLSGIIKEMNRDNDTDGKVIIKKGEIEELEAYCKRANAKAWEFYCHRYDGVDEFFIAKDGDTICCITWIYKKNDPNRFLILGETDALVQYGLTLPQYRGHGLLPAVLQAIAQYLGTQGYRRVYGMILESNRSSIRGTTKAGFVKVGEVRYRKILGMQFSGKHDVSRLSQ